MSERQTSVSEWNVESVVATITQVNNSETILEPGLVLEKDWTHS